jgi:hypothetical protein
LSEAINTRYRRCPKPSTTGLVRWNFADVTGLNLESYRPTSFTLIVMTGRSAFVPMRRRLRMEVRIIERCESHLLVARDKEFVIIERRNNRLYNCHGHAREGIPEHDLSAIQEIVDEGDWTDEATARAAFQDVIARGNELSERMR